MKPKSVDELWEHRGDLVEVNKYSSVWNWIFRKKIIGRMEIPNAWENKDYYNKQKGLIWTVHPLIDLGGEYMFFTIKEDYTLDQFVEEWSKSILHKKQLKQKYSKELVSLEEIKIIECYHKE